MEANYFTIFYCFCHTLTCIRHRYTRVLHPEPASHLPPCTILLGRLSAPAPSIQYHASNLDWRFISHMILYMFQCHSPKSSHPHPLPQSPKDCSIHLCLFCCLAHRVIIWTGKFRKCLFTVIIDPFRSPPNTFYTSFHVCSFFCFYFNFLFSFLPFIGTSEFSYSSFSPLLAWKLCILFLFIAWSHGNFLHRFFTNFPLGLLRCNHHIALCKFKVYSIMFDLHILWNNYHNKFS